MARRLQTETIGAGRSGGHAVSGAGTSEALWRERVRHAKDAHEEQEGRHGFEHEDGKDVVLAVVARAPTVLSEAAAPTLRLA
jgi:hypothetical protein